MRTHVLNNNIPNLKQGEDRTNTIEILVPADMRNYSLFLFFALPDGSKTFTPKLTMTDNKVSYVIPAGITAKTGRVTVELQGYLDNRLIKSVSYAFFVVAAVSTPVDPPFEDFVPWYLEVMQKADQVETDKSAVSAMKNQIKTDETQRQVNELVRKENEDTRMTAEQGRVTTEQGRTTAETRRLTAETTRLTAEQGRVTAEAGRRTAETGRVNAESARASAEQGRVSAEASRVTAESNRQAVLDAKVPKTTTVNGKALSANVSVTSSDVPNTPAGGVAANTVQDAINELDTEKANKTQEGWQTPTLLNGVTGNIKFLKDTLGFVHFQGDFTMLSKTMFIVPVGYRPSENLGVVASRGGRIGIWADGSIRQWDPNAFSDNSLNHVTYKAEV